MALISLSPPASSLLLDPTALRTRLAGAGIAVSADDAASLAAMASAETAAVLGYDPAYQPWRQTYGSTSSPYLYLTPRPVRAITTAVDGAGTALGAASYRLEDQRLARGPYGWQSSGSWPTPDSWPVLTGADVSAPDWSVDFTAGWWLPGWDPEDNEDSIPILDGSITDYAYQVAKAAQFRGETYGAEEMEIRGMKLKMRGATAIGRNQQAAVMSAGYIVEPTRGVLRWRAPLV